MERVADARAISLTVEVPSERGQLPTIWGDVARAIAPLGADARWLEHVSLVLIEGVTNAMVHGHSEDGRPLRVELTVDADTLELRVFDSGPGFELPPGPVPVPDPLAESGRGIFLMKTLADDVAYRRGQGENVLVLRKGISRGLAARQ